MIAVVSDAVIIDMLLVLVRSVCRHSASLVTERADTWDCKDVSWLSVGEMG